MTRLGFHMMVVLTQFASSVSAENVVRRVMPRLLADPTVIPDSSAPVRSVKKPIAMRVGTNGLVSDDVAKWGEKVSGRPPSAEQAHLIHAGHEVERQKIAVIVRMVAPIAPRHKARLHRTAAGLFGGSTPYAKNIDYHLIAAVDETNVVPGSTAPHLKSFISGVANQSRFQVFSFTSDSMYSAFPTFENYSHDRTIWGDQWLNNPYRKPNMWFAQREAILAWRRAQPDNGSSFSYMWLLQDDVELFFQPRGHQPQTLSDFLANIDSGSHADVYGYGYICPANWGLAKRTPEFNKIRVNMVRAHVPWICFSDGLQRLSHAMLDAFALEIAGNAYGFFESQLHPIAWKHKLRVQQDHRSHPLHIEDEIRQAPFPPHAICNSLPPRNHVSDDEVTQGLLGLGDYQKLVNCDVLLAHMKDHSRSSLEQVLEMGILTE